MANYRTTQQPFTKNFGGINQNATVMSMKDNEAEDIKNFDIGDRGSIKKRGGVKVYPRIVDAGDSVPGYYNVPHINALYDLNGRYCYWDSHGFLTDFTDSGTYFIGPSTGTYSGIDSISVGFNGTLFIAESGSDPVHADPLGVIQSLEEASKIDPPTDCAVTVVSNGAATYAQCYFVVTAVTGRGETTASNVAGNANAVRLGWNGNNYNTITWTPVDGALYYNVYWKDVSGTNAWELLGTVTNPTSTYTQSAASATPIVYCPTTNTSYNTPDSWNTDGQPSGFHVLSVGDGERVAAWRGNTVWVSALENGLDWFKPNDAFAFTVNNTGDNQITGMATLYDYTIIFTGSQAYVYSGSGPTDFSLSKILPVGCKSHKSIVHAGTDVYFWSQYGPASVSRILQGADVSVVVQNNERINPIIFDTLNQDKLDKITGVNDPKNRRIIWSCMQGTKDYHDFAVVYQYDVNAWTTYDAFFFSNAICDKDLNIYGCGGYTLVTELFFPGGTDTYYEYLCASGIDPSISQDMYMHSYTMHGIYDDTLYPSVTFTAQYDTCWYDMSSWFPKKRVVFCDILVNRDLGNYSASVYWSFDYDRYTSSPITLTQTTTDGSTISTTSSTTTQHRVYTNGIGNAFQFVFSSTDNQPCEIIGWRPNTNFKGYR